MLCAGRSLYLSALPWQLALFWINGSYNLTPGDSAEGAALSAFQLSKRQLGNLRGVFNPQPANRNDLFGDKLRERVATILQA